MRDGVSKAHKKKVERAGHDGALNNGEADGGGSRGVERAHSETSASSGRGATEKGRALAPR